MLPLLLFPVSLPAIIIWWFSVRIFSPSYFSVFLPLLQFYVLCLLWNLCKFLKYEIVLFCLKNLFFICQYRFCPFLLSLLCYCLKLSLFFNFIFKLYITVLVLPNIKMNLPQVYMRSPSWTLLPPPSPFHPSGSSQCTSPKHPVSFYILYLQQIEVAMVIYTVFIPFNFYAIVKCWTGYSAIELWFSDCYLSATSKFCVLFFFFFLVLGKWPQHFL